MKIESQVIKFHSEDVDNGKEKNIIFQFNRWCAVGDGNWVITIEHYRFIKDAY